jgi:hypothetical protein
MPRNPDRTDLCHFTYADGRRCTLPQFPDDFGLCFHHREKLQSRAESREAGRQVSRFLETDVLTACDLSCTLSALFGATAQGYIKPRTAKALAYIAQLMLQSQQLAKAEFILAGGKSWTKIVRQAPAFNPADDEADNESATADSEPLAAHQAAKANPTESPSPNSDSPETASISGHAQPVPEANEPSFFPVH